MIIRIKDFRLEQQPTKGFDLIREVKSKRIGDGDLRNPTGEDYIKDELIGYNMTLESCITNIIHIIQSDDLTIVSLQEFLESYKQLKEEILNILK